MCQRWRQGKLGGGDSRRGVAGPSNKAMELAGRIDGVRGRVAAGRRAGVVDTAAAGGRHFGACGGRQLIAKPLDGQKREPGIVHGRTHGR